jgi:2-oxoglutarate dehydrogenase E2 component (dihydrolipoamide succinyltransferase)
MSKVQIIVPTLGESVTEATVAKWYKNSGEFVSKDEVVVELETDKVTLEVVAPEGGQLAEINSQTGSTVEIGGILGSIDTSVAAPAVTQQVAPEKTPEEPTQQTVKNYPSPAAQVILDSNNIKSSDVIGTGKDGRITKEDAVKAVQTPKAEVPQKSPEKIDVRENRETRVKMSRLRQTIARRLKDVQNTAAILTTFNEIDMHEVMKLRSENQDEFQKKHNVKLGFMSFFVKAVVTALKEFPAVNAEIDGDDIVYKNFYDIGIAVGTDSGLVVPVLRNADSLSLADIEKEIANLGKRARDGKLTMNDMTGGTFTITNGGTYGSLLSTPIINPPQSGILGMHNIVQRPVGLPSGEIALRPMMYIALSYDHRIIDGKEAVQFLVKVKQLVEKPVKMLIEI